ncbi:transposase, partial [Bifidobacterium vansinderenii]
MCKARRDRYVELIAGGMNYTQAARAVGVSKRTGKVWRNGGASGGRRVQPSVVIRYAPVMHESKTISPRFLDLESRISIADWRHAGMGVREIARRLGRPASTVSRELARNTNPSTGEYEPNRAQRMSAGRRSRPKTAKVRAVPGLLDYIRRRLSDEWSPEQIMLRLRRDFPDNEAMH